MAGAAFVALTLLTSVPSAAAAFVAPPPPRAGLEIISFPERDFVSIGGYAAGDVLKVEVLRKGFVVGVANGVTQNAEGLWEVNHPGGSCWEGVTPNIIAGDVIRVTNGPDVDATFTQDVSISGRGAVATNTTVVMHGTATDLVTGERVPRRNIEARLIEPALTETEVGRRDVRAPQAPDRNGITGRISYDGPTTHKWTATWTGFRSAATARLAARGQDRILWLGRANPATTTEITIFEREEVGGPGMGGCPAAARAPTVALSEKSDKGLSASDGVTRVRRLQTVGKSGDAGSNAVVKLFVDGRLRKQVTASGGSYATRLRVSRGRHTLVAREVLDASTGAMSAPSKMRKLRIDLTRPQARLRGIRQSRRAAAFDYRIGESARLEAKVVNASGRTVRSFRPRMVTSAASVSLPWDFKNEIGRRVHPGTYRMVLEVTDVAGNVSRDVARVRVR